MCAHVLTGVGMKGMPWVPLAPNTRSKSRCCHEEKEEASRAKRRTAASASEEWESSDFDVCNFQKWKKQKKKQQQQQQQLTKPNTEHKHKRQQWKSKEERDETKDNAKNAKKQDFQRRREKKKKKKTKKKKTKSKETTTARKMSTCCSDEQDRGQNAEDECEGQHQHAPSAAAQHATQLHLFLLFKPGLSSIKNTPNNNWQTAPFFPPKSWERNYWAICNVSLFPQCRQWSMLWRKIAWQ